MGPISEGHVASPEVAGQGVEGGLMEFNEAGNGLTWFYNEETEEFTYIFEDCRG